MQGDPFLDPARPGGADRRVVDVSVKEVLPMLVAFFVALAGRAGQDEVVKLVAAAGNGVVHVRFAAVAFKLDAAVRALRPEVVPKS